MPETSTLVDTGRVEYPVKPHNIDVESGLPQAFDTARQRENMVRAIRFWQQLEPEFNCWPLIAASEVQEFCAQQGLGDFDVECLLAGDRDNEPGFLVATDNGMYRITHEAVAEAFWVAPKLS